jgi:hypothetical protein
MPLLDWNGWAAEMGVGFFLFRIKMVMDVQSWSACVAPIEFKA